jgi:RNAse (barnase) inhibitor barstar
MPSSHYIPLNEEVASALKLNVQDRAFVFGEGFNVQEQYRAFKFFYETELSRATAEYASYRGMDPNKIARNAENIEQIRDVAVKNAWRDVMYHSSPKYGLESRADMNVHELIAMREFGERTEDINEIYKSGGKLSQEFAIDEPTRSVISKLNDMIEYDSRIKGAGSIVSESQALDAIQLSRRILTTIENMDMENSEFTGDEISALSRLKRRIRNASGYGIEENEYIKILLSRSIMLRTVKDKNIEEEIIKAINKTGEIDTDDLEIDAELGEESSAFYDHGTDYDVKKMARLLETMDEEEARRFSIYAKQLMDIDKFSMEVEEVVKTETGEQVNIVNKTFSFKQNLEMIKSLELGTKLKIGGKDFTTKSKAHGMLILEDKAGKAFAASTAEEMDVYGLIDSLITYTNKSLTDREIAAKQVLEGLLTKSTSKRAESFAEEFISAARLVNSYIENTNTQDISAQGLKSYAEILGEMFGDKNISSKVAMYSKEFIDTYTEYGDIMPQMLSSFLSASETSKMTKFEIAESIPKLFGEDMSELAVKQMSSNKYANIEDMYNSFRKLQILDQMSDKTQENLDKINKWNAYYMKELQDKPDPRIYAKLEGADRINAINDLFFRDINEAMKISKNSGADLDTVMQVYLKQLYGRYKSPDAFKALRSFLLSEGAQLEPYQIKRIISYAENAQDEDLDLAFKLKAATAVKDWKPRSALEEFAQFVSSSEDPEAAFEKLKKFNLTEEQLKQVQQFMISGKPTGSSNIFKTETADRVARKINDVVDFKNLKGSARGLLPLGLMFGAFALMGAQSRAEFKRQQIEAQNLQTVNLLSSNNLLAKQMRYSPTSAEMSATVAVANQPNVNDSMNALNMLGITNGRIEYRA